MCNKKVALICALVTVFLAANSLAAIDLYPPSWRGQSRTTLTVWEFTDNDETPGPSSEYNPYGEAAAQIVPDSANEWVPLYEDRQGVWRLSGGIIMHIDNCPLELEEKEIRVQIVWKSKESFLSNGDIPTVSEVESGAESEIIGGALIDEENEWSQTTHQMFLYPNPSHETIVITGDIWVDEVIVDTICIPEPTVVLMLSLGAFVTRRRPKRQ